MDIVSPDNSPDPPEAVDFADLIAEGPAVRFIAQSELWARPMRELLGDDARQSG